jgi:hypothetical protein
MAKKSFVVAPPPKALSAADLGFINNGPGKDNVPPGGLKWPMS